MALTFSSPCMSRFVYKKTVFCAAAKLIAKPLPRHPLEGKANVNSRGMLMEITGRTWTGQRPGDHIINLYQSRVSLWVRDPAVQVVIITPASNVFVVPPPFFLCPFLGLDLPWIPNGLKHSTVIQPSLYVSQSIIKINSLAISPHNDSGHIFQGTCIAESPKPRNSSNYHKFVC